MEEATTKGKTEWRKAEPQIAKTLQKWHVKSTTDLSFGRDPGDAPYAQHLHVSQACICFKCPTSPSLSFIKAL